MSPDADSEQQSMDTVIHVLRHVRDQLGMDVSFLSEFRDGWHVFRHVSAVDEVPVAAGDMTPLEETYCQRVVDGRLPEVLPDTSRSAEAQALVVTHELPIGAHISVPVHLPDGELFGTFCCFSRQPEPSLRERDAAFMRVLASLLAGQLAQERAEREAKETAQAQIARALATPIRPVYQPVVDLVSGDVLGFEALARFPIEPARPPNEWFSEAGTLGRGAELEIAALQAALSGFTEWNGQLFLSLKFRRKP